MAASASKEVTFAWEGTDKKGKRVKGDAGLWRSFC